ncbi:type II toxin-antitoxin system VapC family toxin [Gloeobacter violaceus]|uniref:Gll0721 protein n=1 Tax=Gloeobacter violaceus (strain ATCC 29082 / PCC 7421) TaxID=251221 RepID=Q7NMP4_GLOVI|nr:type II toxin-antitoxin system VapC family toxin [Gloeobacter violaceus]BAC88662.1 gll0721 [Gloeobacter violaceus PCC 7421]
MWLVVDSSTVVKWFFPEVLTEQALAIRRAWESSDVELIAPTLLLTEVGNVIWKKQRNAFVTYEEGAQIVCDLLVLELPLVEAQNLLPRAYQLAAIFQRTVYDALYLALAEQLEAEFVTADLRLYNAVYPILKFVRYLGNYS